MEIIKFEGGKNNYTYTKNTISDSTFQLSHTFSSATPMGTNKPGWGWSL